MNAIAAISKAIYYTDHTNYPQALLNLFQNLKQKASEYSKFALGNQESSAHLKANILENVLQGIELSEADAENNDFVRQLIRSF